MINEIYPLQVIKHRSSQYCCVPFICTPASRYYPKVYFHEIPSDPELKRQTNRITASLAIEVTYSHMFKYYINYFIDISENGMEISYAVVLAPPPSIHTPYLSHIK